MTRGYGLKLMPAALLAMLALPPGVALAAPVPEKDQDRIAPEAAPPAAGKDTDSLLPHVPDDGSPLGVGQPAEAMPGLPGELVPGEEPDLEEMFAEDIPDLQAVELTEDGAKRALDAFAKVFGKFDDEEIAKYPTLQEFAEKSPQGKKFAAVIRKHGFKSVKEWNDIITNIGFAFTSIEEGHDDEVFRQIKEAEARTDMPKERREKLLKYLRALIPSLNNRKVVQGLLKDPEYRKKLYLLEGGGGEE